MQLAGLQHVTGKLFVGRLGQWRVVGGWEGGEQVSSFDSWLKNWGETYEGDFYLQSCGNFSIHHVIHQTWDLNCFIESLCWVFFMNTQPVKLLNDYLNRQIFDLRFMLTLNPNQAVYFLGFWLWVSLLSASIMLIPGLPEKSTYCCQISLLFLYEISWI